MQCLLHFELEAVLLYTQDGEQMDKEELYQFEKRINSAIKNIENATTITPRNKELIIEFKNDLYAENLSKARVLYYLNRLKRLAELLGMDFDKATQQDLKKLMVKINTEPLFSGRCYAEKTKTDFAISICKFYKWLNKTDGTRPDIIKGKWLRTTARTDHVIQVQRENLITEEELLKMIQACNSTRDRAFIITLYESGCRIGEMLTMKIGSFAPGDPISSISVNGKTGRREVMVCKAKQYIIDWLNSHPRASDKSAGLWAKSNGKGIGYATCTKILRESAKIAGLKRRIYPHLFRHSRATQLSKSMNPYLLCRQFGWKLNSRMPSVYLHLDGDDLKEEYAKVYGLESKKKKETRLNTIKCPRCDTENQPHFSMCKCGLSLDPISIEEFKKEREDEVSALKMLRSMLKTPGGEEFLKNLKAQADAQKAIEEKQGAVSTEQVETQSKINGVMEE